MSSVTFAAGAEGTGLLSALRLPLRRVLAIDAFRGLTIDRARGMTYRVHLRYGPSYEPWVAGVEVTEPSNQ